MNFVKIEPRTEPETITCTETDVQKWKKEAQVEVLDYFLTAKHAHSVKTDVEWNKVFKEMNAIRLSLKAQLKALEGKQ